MQKIVGPITNHNGKLWFDGVNAKELVDKFDTPLFVISENRIRENYNRLSKALKSNYQKTRICYAAKANSNISVLRILETEGSSVDAVSPGEVSLSLKASFPPERILFTGTSVRNDELKFLIDSKVTINVDSFSQLDRLLRLGVPNLLSVRINPEIGAGYHSHVITAGKDSKFGIWAKDAPRVYETAKKAGVSRFGIHMHVGSGILNVKAFVLALDRLLEISKKIHKSVGVDFDFIDMGGGIGVPYRQDDPTLDLDLLSHKVLTLFKRRIHDYDLGDPFFYVEPGRYIVSDASILLTKVNTVKTTPFKNFVGVDAGFNTLVRPTMYGSYHHILVANKLDLTEEEVYDVVGPICESGDILAKDRQLPKIQEGDLLAVLNAGAYGFSMSSQYNARPRAAEVLVKNGKYTLIRKREKLGDLLRGQIIAEWLK
ncbi:diaminopimelate decarboxylase [Candidatus Bathyarchaeota archaeon]|nr:diaminopimelate decarboxylase [Candidatus Bathyarchaeota archaeon]